MAIVARANAASALGCRSYVMGRGRERAGMDISKNHYEQRIIRDPFLNYEIFKAQIFTLPISRNFDNFFYHSSSYCIKHMENGRLLEVLQYSCIFSSKAHQRLLDGRSIWNLGTCFKTATVAFDNSSELQVKNLITPSCHALRMPNAQERSCVRIPGPQNP